MELLIADAQAKSSATNGTANGTTSKAKAGKVVFGATGNRLLDKQQANSAAKPPVPKPEVGLPQVTFPGVYLSLLADVAHVNKSSCGERDGLRQHSGCNQSGHSVLSLMVHAETSFAEHAGEEGRVKVQGLWWQTALSEGLTAISCLVCIVWQHAVYRSHISNPRELRDSSCRRTVTFVGYPMAPTMVLWFIYGCTSPTILPSWQEVAISDDSRTAGSRV